jgi:hypothetical protein
MWHALDNREKYTRFWWEKNEGKRPLGRLRRGWEDVVRMDLREKGWGSTEWIQLAEDTDQYRAVVKVVMTASFITFLQQIPWIRLLQRIVAHIVTTMSLVAS